MKEKLSFKDFGQKFIYETFERKLYSSFPDTYYGIKMCDLISVNK